ncbi:MULTISPECIES: glucose-6-phosphate dehydrogenase [unclassified Commensalibacter]|uniref:glucose-6-phosphate dehydrogenase n=1 Tax=unclassified Commensalibacter TaxID=2630218 RepID=UPI0018DBE849|nr:MULTISPECIES: glucose-6-phosphate dehydrogenase [unclassified Commensalibacter]MBH9969131.1 glucose-6-phosphate dehydrogenase [Commensalibacter sp. M0265]MBH9976486.1 glucose-6-phosphate dehydrogenase [Commensalibacter sp. M0266]MBH9992577.1 glucose-6-phosphate dehydrogenase [Commensalibacter sp. M0270]MBI0045662.1 glucose-6-phosphate dehydrogenase [Commensalibacter sp. M0267]MBI0055331.1 glucose-6-phosphate dehydrogenase [Commensalibacter sp. M0268]
MEQTQAYAPFDIIIFGATGDLTARKLLPALYYRYLDKQIPPQTRIIGTARSPLTDDDFKKRIHDGLVEFVQESYQDPENIRNFLNLISYVSLNGAEADSNWPELQAKFEHNKANDIRIFYFATAPRLYGDICDNLALKKLITPTTRIILEKPIGTSLKTAEEINQRVGKHFPENNIYRIDHYLGKETVQNVIALRFANPVFERLWNSDAIDYVQITAAETVGVGKRGGYYDGAGALRDMVQNHLLQVLCMVAMDPPISLNADDLRNEKLKVLRSLKPMTEQDIKDNTVRGQYTSCIYKNEKIPGYLEDLGKDQSNTETFITLKAEINTARWGGVPFYLRTGKRLAKKVSEIIIQFKPSAWNLFATPPKANRLVIRIQPDEGVSLSLQIKDPQKTYTNLRSTSINIEFPTAFHIRYPDSYEGLLMDVVKGDPILFIRRDEVEASWRWIEPILDGWAKNLTPLTYYKAGSWGPQEALDLLDRANHVWHENMTE